VTIEHDLLDRLRANPRDDETRAVLADLCEQQGQLDRAAYLRGQPVTLDPADAPWRVVVAREWVARCNRSYRQGCGTRWENLGPSITDDVRHCATCARDVRYCETLGEAAECGRIKASAVIDPSLDEGAAKDRYDRG